MYIVRMIVVLPWSGGGMLVGRSESVVCLCLLSVFVSVIYVFCRPVSRVALDVRYNTSGAEVD